MCDELRLRSQHRIVVGDAQDIARDAAVSLEWGRGVEIGNIFQLGTRYTDAPGVQVTDADGEFDVR